MELYDPDIRKLLLKKFFEIDEFISDPTTKVVSEMDVCFGASRIDIAVINGRIHGFEIKSERDKLERLPSQIKAYNKVFDTVTVVVSENHFPKIVEMVPDWWGIFCVSKDNQVPSLTITRHYELNKEVDVFYLVQLLWKNELLELLGTKGKKSKTRFALCKMAVENIEEENIKEFVREKLKSRKDWRAVQLQQLYGDLLQ